MTETIESTGHAGPDAPEGGAKKRGGGLSTMLVADLKAMASGLGISGAGSMKKPQLVQAIKAAQSGGGQKKRQEERPAEAATEAERTAEGEVGQEAGQRSASSRTAQERRPRGAARGTPS